jgi:hypothetical protein
MRHSRKMEDGEEELLTRSTRREKKRRGPRAGLSASGLACKRDHEVVFAGITRKGRLDAFGGIRGRVVCVVRSGVEAFAGSESDG